MPDWQEAEHEFVPRKMDLEGLIADWNLKDTTGLVDGEVATLIQPARDLLNVDVANGFAWDFDTARARHS